VRTSEIFLERGGGEKKHDRKAYFVRVIREDGIKEGRLIV
jgi:hypothetical protein